MTRKFRTAATTTSAPTVPALPDGIIEDDLKAVSYDDRDDRLSYEESERIGDFGTLQLYYVDHFGWCICTLLIKHASRRARSRGVESDRFYAVRVSDGSLVRIGHGPHVRRQVTVHLRKSRLAALEKYVALFASGNAKANEARDRRSMPRTRRGFPFGF